MVDPDIRRAWTLPSEVYTDAAFWALQADRVFAPAWHLVPTWQAGADGVPATPGQVLPLSLLPGFLDEPVLLTRAEDDRLRCLSNVCTHRGNLVAQHPDTCSVLRCRYHGRRFGLDGRLRSMPEFDDVEGFPSPADDLPRLELETWGPLAFVRSSAAAGSSRSPDFTAWAGPMLERLAGLPLEALRFDRSRSRDYLVQAHWALYVENYLEGFHIPFVHPSLADELDYGAYRTELFPWSSLQLGVAAGGDEVFDPVPGSVDEGTAVAAYYWWLFPHLMVNVYPWGLSLNLVQPLGPRRTKVSFVTWVADPERLDAGAGASLDRVEREDEAVVEAVQRGLASRHYRRGRYSPRREQGVHHFHRLLARALAVDGAQGSTG